MPAVTEQPTKQGPRKDLHKKRRDWLRSWGALKTDRTSWDTHWGDLSEFLLPRQGRFFTTDRNRGGRRDEEILNCWGTLAAESSAAGLKAHASSSARPWFRLRVRDRRLNQNPAVKRWLEEVEQILQGFFADSNTYETLHHIYSELLVFGTGATVLMPDPETALWHHPLTIGEYAIATDYRGRVNTLYREFERTVAETVEEFGLERCSHATRNRHQNGDLHGPVSILHVIEPRKHRDHTKHDRLNMPWVSCYLELGGGDHDMVLRESGYREFPALVPRWKVAGGDVYGHSPGMNVLGDIMSLQQLELRKGQVVDYQTAPPKTLPSTLQNQVINRMPGGFSFHSALNDQAKIEDLYDAKYARVDHIDQSIARVEQRIDRGLFRDLFQLLSAAERDPRMTAFEVAIRQEEKMTILGPALDRLHNELLEPLVDFAFRQLIETGAHPPLPEELLHRELQVEFISTLAQAQKAINSNSIDRFVLSLGQVAAMKGDVVDKFDADAWADRYSDLLGVPPELVVPGKKVALVRQERARAEAAVAQSQLMAEQAKAARDLAASPVGESNALDLLGQTQGYTSPTALELAQ